MQNDQSSYSRCSWMVALVLALILLWMLMTGKGPSCNCAAPVTTPEAATAAIIPAEAPAAEAFHFSATSSDFTNTGGSAAEWVGQVDTLKDLLSGDMKAEGDDKNVVLTGTVDTDATKQQKGADAQAFFGSSVTVDNQLTVKSAEPVAATAPPPAAKLYFDTGKTTLKAAVSADLAPIVDWLKANADTKAVISGFHDPRGDQAFNELLAKNRAKAVREALKTAGIDEARIEMRKPQSIDGGADLAEARRVEVSVE